MDLNITDEQLMGLVENSVKGEVRRRIDNSVNNGIAGWFEQSSIQRMTYNILRQEYLPKITADFIEGLNIDLAELASIVGKEVENCLLKSFDLYEYGDDR
jgi:hypothetical protein